MNVAILHDERTLADLVNRLYQVPESSRSGRLLHLARGESEALIQKASEALRRANPMLANLAALPQGTVIVVPTVEGLAHTEAVRAPRPLSDELLDGAFESTAEALKEVERAVGERRKQLGDLLKEFETDEVKPLTQFALFPEALKATREEASTLTRELPRLNQLHKEILSQLEEDLTAMTKLLS